MVKDGNGIARGRNCEFDLGSTRMTKGLIVALDVLDGECERGARWDISRAGRNWVAEPCNGPFEPIVYRNGSWVNVWD